MTDHTTKLLEKFKQLQYDLLFPELTERQIEILKKLTQTFKINLQTHD